MKAQIIYFLFLLGFTSIGAAQNLPEKGVPYLKNFEPSEYNNKGKVWAIDTSPNGMVFMASDKGLIEYDGKNWKNYTGSDGFTRSILVANDSVIVTGSDLDFGIWKKNKYQEFEYTSIYPFKEDLNEINEEFWNLHSINGTLFFISSNNIYVYKNENLTKIPTTNRISKSFIIDGVLHFVDEVDGLYQLKDLAPEHLFHFDEDIALEIIGAYQENGELVFVTKSDGLFRYSSKELKPINNLLSRALRSASVFSFEKINDSYLAFGTIFKGLFITDLGGEILHSVNKNKGLLNNTILSLHYGKNGKLWMGMDFGVSYLDLNNEFTFFYDYQGNFGTGYSAVLKDQNLYLGTNQGLYRSNWENLNNKNETNSFEFIPGTEGQVWTVKNIEDQVLIGHDRGFFKLQNDELTRLNDQQGFWTFQQYKNFLLAGTYNGILIFEKRGNDWRFLKQMDLILGSCNQVFIDGENTLWVNIPNFGIIKAELDEDLVPIDREIYLSKSFKGSDHNIIQNSGEIYIETDSFRYEIENNEVLEKPLSESLKTTNKQKILNTGSVKLNSDFEFHPVYNGFALKDLRIVSTQKDSSHQLIVRNITAFNNEEEVSAFDGIELSYKLNNIKIESIVPNKDQVFYQFKLNKSDNWSSWSAENIIEFLGLKHGNYTLFARAKIDDWNTPIETINFEITPPWYQTNVAYIIYFLMILCFAYMLYVWQKVSMKKLKRNLLVKQQNSLRDQEKRYKKQLQHIKEETLKAEYEHVKAQLKSKTIELATQAKENDEVNKVLQSLKEKIEILEQNPDSIKSRSGEIKRILDSHISEDDNTFEIQMDELHQEFFDKLRRDFSELTTYDLRLCAYLKLGFNSKEIANLLNIMPSSVYISRSRLRKKLDLDTDKDLHSFLSSF